MGGSRSLSLYLWVIIIVLRCHTKIAINNVHLMHGSGGLVAHETELLADYRFAKAVPCPGRTQIMF